MKFHSQVAAVAAFAFLSTAAIAQTGQLDQVSPYPGTTQTAGFNGSASSLVWQAQVRVGIAGQLEGFKLFLNGSMGSHIDVRLRVGDGWNQSPVVFSDIALKTNSSFNEQVFIDATSANLVFAVGDTFVIEMQGQDDGGGLLGTYTPPPGIPLYPELLFLGGGGCFADCGWRIAFETYVVGGGTPVTYCTSGTSTHGCAAAINASANPSVNYTTPCQITVNNVEGQKSGIVFYGLMQTVSPWCSMGGGSSFLCVKAPTKRTGVQNSGGTANSCNGTLNLDWNAYQQANPGALGAPWSAGQKAYVQGWFRDPPACKTTGLSNAVQMTYTP